MADWRQQEECEQRRWEEEFGQAPAVDRRMEKKMGIIAMDSGGGGDFKRVPAGTHVARCFRVIDLGTQSVEWQGSVKLQRKVQISWEVFGEDDEGAPLTTDDGMPLVISKRYTLSLSDKARLRADLESWRGRAFTSDELSGFDITNLLDAFCMLSVIEVKNGDKTYSNISAIAQIPKAMRSTLPKGIHEPQVFDVSDPDMEMFSKFYEKLKETIAASTEWRSRQNGPTRAKAAQPDDPFGDSLDDPPF